MSTLAASDQKQLVATPGSSLSSFAKDLLAGGMSGIVAKTIGNLFFLSFWLNVILILSHYGTMLNLAQGRQLTV
jgi:hypothetical protein